MEALTVYTENPRELFFMCRVILCAHAVEEG